MLYAVAVGEDSPDAGIVESVRGFLQISLLV